MTTNAVLAVAAAVLALSSWACASEIIPSALPTPASAHFAEAGITFDYPPDWQERPQNIVTRAGTVIGFVGTAPSEYHCDQTPTSLSCETRWNLVPGSVSMMLSRSGRPSEPIWKRPLRAGEARVPVGGRPGIVRRVNAINDADEILAWDLSVPFEPSRSLQMTAAMRGPGVDMLKDQVDALIASIRYDPPVPPLVVGAPQAEAVARALDTLVASDAGYECFPRTVGGRASQTISTVPGYPPLSQPLSAVCGTDVEATPIGVWQMTLTIWWDRAADHEAGSLVTVVWVDPQGGLSGSTIEGVDVPYTP